MSTAGSVRSTGIPSTYAPPAPGTGSGAGGAPPAATPPKRIAVFRWQGIIPLALFLVLLAGWWSLFGERTVRDTAQEAATKALGTQVDIASVMLDELHTVAELRGIAIADPFDRNRNLIEAASLRIELEPEPLLERKLVVRRLSLGDVRTGTRRAVPARPVAGDGFAPRALREMDRWAKQFQVPLLSLTPFDTVKAIVLDPTQLATVKEAVALAARTDSVRDAIEAGYTALRLQETLDSTQALVARLQRTSPRALGIAGARGAVADIRRTAARIDSVKRGVEALHRSARGGVEMLQQGVRTLDVTRRSDYAFARGLLKLPTVDAPDMGAAFFGPVTIDRFQQALYWTQLARDYAPPGLLPREEPGPKRLRRAGSTIRFLERAASPRMLLRRGDLQLRVNDGILAGAYTLAVSNVTSDPALLGKPTYFALRRAARGSDLDSLRVVGMLDHTTSRPRDLVTVHAAGITLPSFPLPALPYRAELGRGASDLRLELVGDQVAARWTTRSGDIAWRTDSARARALNTLEALVARVVTGVREVDVTAEMRGRVTSPTLTVRSSLDRAVADQLRRVAGEELKRAETKVRAQVDRLVEERAAPVRARVDSLRTDAERRVTEARTRLEEERKRLEAQLKTYSGGLVSLPKLPG